MCRETADRTNVVATTSSKGLTRSARRHFIKILFLTIPLEPCVQEAQIRASPAAPYAAWRLAP